MKLLSKKEVGQRRVYDIEVEDVHNFYANGVNVHNCATDGGVSVIKDDGTVVDSDVTPVFSSVFFSSDYYLYALDTTFANDLKAFGDVAGITSDGFTREAIYWEQTTDAVKLSDDVITDVSEYPNGFTAAAQGVRPGLNTVYENRSAYTEGMVAYTTSTYNTGWMPGDIKGAFLSDTDDTDLVGATAFNDDASATTNWTLNTGWAHDATNDEFDHTTGNTGTLERSVSGLTDGALYALQVTITNRTAGSVTVSLEGSTKAGITGDDWLTFTASGTTGTLAITPTSDFDGSISAVRADLADADRSVNNNGLIVNGTVTREPVAPGADLVAYSGFNASNYLEQPYNPDLDFGTGDFCVMGWVKTTDTVGCIILRQDTGGSGGYFGLRINGSSFQFLAGTGITASTDIDDDIWHFACGVRRNGVMEIYTDAVLESSASAAVDVDNASAVTRIGLEPDDTAALSPGSLALLRISATAPTPEQIKRIYEDEKVLFQENAQATLYGTSDAVTALAHDEVTDLLHVGTSDGRSVFQGLRRVENTTTPVNTAISAVGGMIAED